MRDLAAADAGESAFVFDWEKASLVMDFAENLVIPDIEATAENPRRQLRLLPWHKFIYANLFGFVRKSDPTRRRFQDCYIEVARKNSKTTSLLFPILLYDFLTTPAAESYFVNKDLLQSEKSYKELLAIIKSDDDLAKCCEVNSQTIVLKSSRIAFFADGSTAIDGYKNSCSIIDEYHAYDSDKIVTAFRYGGRSRKNRLILKITSAGLDISKPCYAENQAAKKVLDGLHRDESYFCIIYAYDEEDDWKNPALFRKANPSIERLPALSREVLESDLADALSKPAHQPDFKSKTCGIWTNGVARWIALDVWEESKAKNAERKISSGETVGIALDLSEVNDFSAISVCALDGGIYRFEHEYFIPEETVYEKYATDNQNILEWIAQGYITPTQGRTINEDEVFEKLCTIFQKFVPAALYYDPWQSRAIIKRIEDEFPKIPLVPFGQSLKNFCAPTKNYEKAILDRRIADFSPVHQWMLGNAVVKPDTNGNYKPLKQSKASTKRIDSVITAIMAMTALDENDAKKIESFDSLGQLLKSF